jgi:chromosome segregation ATPase
MAEVFGRKKSAIHITKKDLKQALVKANERFRTANAKMDARLKSGKDILKSIKSDCINAEKDLEAIHDLQGYAKNELGVQETKLAQIRIAVKEASFELKDIQNKVSKLEENDKNLKTKEVSLLKSVALLEEKKSKAREINAELKAIKKEEESGQETLSLLAKELNNLESEVEMYASRKSAAESEYEAFRGKIAREKIITENELQELKNIGSAMKLANGKEMARLDHAIADRLSELNDMKALVDRKKYEYSSLVGKVQGAESKISDAADRAAYHIKKEEDRVKKIRLDFKDWKIGALDDVAKLKLKKKIENIDMAGLKEVLDG